LNFSCFYFSNAGAKGIGTQTNEEECICKPLSRDEPHFATLPIIISCIISVPDAGAVAVSEEVYADNLATRRLPRDLSDYILSQMYKPEYDNYLEAAEERKSAHPL
jgi:hypothetical protein